MKCEVWTSPCLYEKKKLEKKCDKIELAELLKRDVIIKPGSHVTDIGDDHCVGDHSLSKILYELSS